MKTLQIFILSLIVGLLFSGVSFAATNVSTCQVINSPGEYVLNVSLDGAPIDAAPRSGTACIKISASDIVFDCAGYNISNNGTGGTTHGILLNATASNVTVKNCPNISNYTNGIYLISSNYNRILNNTVDNNDLYGVILHASSYNNVTDNIALRGDYGYFVSQGVGNIFENNTASNNDNDGFYIQLNSDNNYFVDNTASGNTRYGFYIFSSSNSSNFTNNVVSGGNTGFYIEEGSYHRFISNNVSSTSSRAIYTTGTSSNNLFYDNILSGGSGYGVRLNDDIGNNNITGNTVYGYSQHGIYSYYSDNNTITDNNASNNSRAGIRLSNSDNAIITDNTANENDYYGIHLSSSHNNTLLRNNATLNGHIGGPTTFHLSQLAASGWVELYSAPFPVDYATKEFQFSKVDNSITVRIVQSGPTPFGDVEAARLFACGDEITPAYAKYVDSGESVLDDILAIDNDVIIAHEKEIEVSWDIPASCNEQTTLFLTANEYNVGLPIYFPDAGYVSLSEDGYVPTIDGKLDEIDGIEDSTYTVNWRSDSGHPDGYTYIYTSQDEENVYISLDVTSDNTNEYGEDWAEVTFATSSGEKSFRIDDYNDEYGKCAFGRTSKVAHKHQTCEFSIPKSEIGETELNFLLRYYGTESVSASAILMEWSDYNVLEQNIMDLTIGGFGAYLHYSDYNNFTNNTVSGNNATGVYLYYSNNTIVTGDHFSNNSVVDFMTYSSSSYTLNLSRVIFDNPLGNLVNYTTLTLDDETEASGSYSINWTQTPPSPPNPSFANKNVNITIESGSPILDSITWHWNSAELSGYNEAGFEIYEYNSSGSWVDLNGVLSTGANTLGLSNLVPGNVYAILAGTVTTIPPSSGGGTSKKSLTATYGQICPGDSIQVNVTSSGSALENAEVRLIYLLTYNVTDKLTNSSGSTIFSAQEPGDYKLIVSKSKYHSQEQTFTYTACPKEEKPPEPPPVEPPPVIPPPVNITIPPFLNVTDQLLTDSLVDIYRAYLGEPGCIVLHLVNADGSPGAVVGMSDVISGNNSDLAINLVNYDNETELMAMLYYDDGDGVCDPDKDAPATVDGTPVAVNFKLTLPPAAPPVEPPKPPVTEEPPLQPPVEGEGFDLLGILLIIFLLILILGGAGALYWKFGRKS